MDLVVLFVHACWKGSSENVDFDFPRLTTESLRFLFLGTYKIKIAESYVEQYQELDSNCNIELDDTDGNMLRCRAQSRRSSAAKRKAWIQYSITGDPIMAWYRTCSAGAITTGYCSHVASIIWYFSYARNIHYEQSTVRLRLRQTILEYIIQS